MEMLPAEWLAEFEIEEKEESAVFIHGMDHLDDLTPEQYATLYNGQVYNERPTMQLEGISTKEQISGSGAASFRNVACHGTSPKDYVRKSGGKNKKASKPSVNPPCTREHAISERERREKLTQQFITLSTLVPGLTKINKASILGACMKYVKQLQTRVQELEEQTSKKTTMESAVFVKKLPVSSSTSSCSTQVGSSDFSIPFIEATMSDGNVLIRIHCEKRKGTTTHILLEAEKLDLDVVSYSVMPFGSSIFNITVMAQMNADCNMTVNDLVKKLSSSIV